MTFDEFVRAEMGGLSRFAGALTGDRYLAEDMLSDALVKVARRWRRIGSVDDPAAYVRRVLVTTYLDDRRKAQRRRLDPSGDIEVLDRPAPDVADALGCTTATVRSHLSPARATLRLVAADGEGVTA